MATLDLSIAVIAKATNPAEKAAVSTTLVVMVAVQVLTAVGRSMKPLCRAQSLLSDSRGTEFSAD